MIAPNGSSTSTGTPSEQAGAPAATTAAAGAQLTAGAGTTGNERLNRVIPAVQWWQRGDLLIAIPGGADAGESLVICRAGGRLFNEMTAAAHPVPVAAVPSYVERLLTEAVEVARATTPQAAP